MRVVVDAVRPRGAPRTSVAREYVETMFSMARSRFLMKRMKKPMHLSPKKHQKLRTLFHLWTWSGI